MNTTTKILAGMVLGMVLLIASKRVSKKKKIGKGKLRYLNPLADNLNKGFISANIGGN